MSSDAALKTRMHDYFSCIGGYFCLNAPFFCRERPFRKPIGQEKCGIACFAMLFTG